MEPKNETPVDAFICEDGDEWARARLSNAIKGDDQLREEVLKQHFIHGLLQADADHKSGATKSRTDAALAKLEPHRVASNRWFPTSIAAAVVLCLGGLAAIIMTQETPKKPANNNDAPIVAEHSKPDKSFGVSRISGESESLIRQDLDEGRRFLNKSDETVTLFLESGANISLDSNAALVLVDGGHRLNSLEGRIAIEGKGTRVSMTDLDAFVFGGPIVADVDKHSLAVFSGKVQSADGKKLAGEGQLLDLRTKSATPMDAGKIPAFISQGRSLELFNEIQAKVGDQLALNREVWLPVLAELLSKPIGRELARESANEFIDMGLTDAEFLDMMRVSDVGLEFLVEMEGIEGAIEESRKNVAIWQNSTPEERKIAYEKTRGMLEQWRDMTPAQKEQWRQWMSSPGGTKKQD